MIVPRHRDVHVETMLSRVMLQALQDELQHVKQLLKGHQELGRMVQRNLDGVRETERR